MSNLSLVEAKLPPGFRFHPRDEELICDYLMKKVASPRHVYPLMIEVDLNKCEPWDIPETACVGGKEWYFYSLRDRKYATGVRTNRATMCGYWKATGKDRPVIQKGTLVGMRKTLVFYQGRAPKGRKSEWVMHEFRLEGALVPPKTSSIKVDWVLCRMFYKNREITHKQGVDDTNPSSLPPLMNPFDNITFNNHQALYEQVPCFSIFNRKTLAQMGANPNLSSNLNPLKSYEEKFIDDVLDHFGTVENNGSSASFGEGSSLSDVGCLPTYVWNY